jgi:two-component system response regulator VicR
MNAGAKFHGLGYVLCVDDDQYLTALLSFALEREGYEVRVAHNGAQALRQIKAESPAAVVLDINLPDIDGFTLCAQIRRHSRIPIILLTARQADDDVITGLGQGADDYVPKPFNMQVLVFRLRAVLNRAQGPNASAVVSERVYRVGDVTFDAQFNQVSGTRGQIQLTPIEGRILRLLLANAGQVFSADRIMELVWGYDAESTAAVVKTHVRRLRQKLETVSDQAALVITVPGMGYTVRQGLSLIRGSSDEVPDPAPLASGEYTDDRGINGSIIVGS